MAAQWLFYNTLIALLILLTAPHLSKSDDSSQLPKFSFSWMDDDDEFYNNDTATINVKVLGDYKTEEYEHPFNPNISVNGTMGNSSYITELHSNFGNDTNNWQILFNPITVGFFNLLITDDNFQVHDDSLHFLVSPAESYVPPHFSYDWPDNKMVFKAGERVSIRVIVFDNFNTKSYRHRFNPNITISDSHGKNPKTGNSSYITGFYNYLGTDTNKFQINFIPIMVGRFYIWIFQENLRVGWSAMHYDATPAEMYLPGCILSWRDDVSDFEAGSRATVMILPKDAFANNVTVESEGKKTYSFTVYATHVNGSDARVSDVNYRGWDWGGYLSIDFTVITSGTLLLHVKNENSEPVGFPLTFTVDPGPLDVSNCLAAWATETKSFQLYSTMETFIIQRDRFGNLVPDYYYDFDFEVIEKGTGLSLPIGDLKYERVVPGVQSFSFKVLAPGGYLLFITDKDKKIRISDMPFEFVIFIAYCDGSKSIVNGSGLHDSVAGEVSKFTVLLRDAYEYPSPLELNRLRVQITLPKLSVHVDAKITPIDSINGTESTGMLEFGAFDPTSVPSSHWQQPSGFWKTWQSAYEVEYVPKKSGNYEIRVFCGNVPLNDGNPFEKYVGPAKVVNVSTSRTIKFDKQVSSGVAHCIDVELRDSFENPVVIPESDMSKLKLESRVYPITVVIYINNKDGTYTIFYMPMNIEYYELCVFYDGGRINPCPFAIISYTKNTFPQPYGEDVHCWEDESIGFYPLENDYHFGIGKIVDYQKPRHGSIVQYGDDVFRYTPYKRYYGNDSFNYSMSDQLGVIVSAQVNVFVLTIPPQFVTIPTKLQAYEDMLSPKFGGFSGFELTYSDSKEDVSIVFSAKNGSIFLSPLLIQLWDPMWNQLSITQTEGNNTELILTARVEVINFAMKSLKYLGVGNFSGEDMLRVSTINKNAKRDMEIPVIVNPINDPPYINAPDYIMLGNVTEDEGFLIFDTQRDNFTLSVGDPDLLHFIGNKSHFRVLFSVEVSTGYFSANLPAVLISTTELKLKNSNQWQPLQTFVEISRQFTIKAKALRFRGTIDECNTVLQQIFYYGDENGGVLKYGGSLKLSVNDLGWYGCYPDCSGMMSVPLITEATIKLVSKTPVDVVVAHSLGSLIVIESIVLISLAVMIIFFTCKCVFLLLHKKVKNQEFQLYQMQDSYEHMSSTDSSSEHMAEQPSSLSNALHEESGLG